MNEPFQRAMFGLGPTELVIILVIIMLIFGIGKLPQVGEGLGKMISGFKKGVQEADEVLEEAPRVDVACPPPTQSVQRKQVAETVEVVEEEHHG